MKSIQPTLVKWKILGIPHVKSVVFHTGYQIIFLLIQFYGKVEQKLVPLCLYSCVIFGDVQIFHP